MATEDNKALVSRYIEDGVNQRNMAVLNELYDPDVMFHDSSLTVYSQELAIEVLSSYLTAFPDYLITIEDMVAEGNAVVVRYTFDGTQKGSLFGIPPTGKGVVVTGITIIRVTDGKITEQWTNADELGMLQQLGLFLD